MKIKYSKLVFTLFLFLCIFGCENEEIEIIDRWQQTVTLNGVHKDNSAFHIINENSIWVVGEKIWKYDGVLWNIVQNPTDNPLISVSGSSDEDIWILSDVPTSVNGGLANNSQLWNWNGYEWKNNNLINSTIYSLHVIDFQTIVLGGSGYIYISYDAGNTWVNYRIPLDSSCDSKRVLEITGGINNLFISLSCGDLAEFNGVSWNIYSNGGPFGSGVGEIDYSDNVNYAIFYSASNVTPVFGYYYLKKYQNQEIFESIDISTALFENPTSDQAQAALRNASFDVPGKIFFGFDNIYSYDGNEWKQETDMNQNIRVIQMLDNNRGWAITDNEIVLKRN